MYWVSASLFDSLFLFVPWLCSCVCVFAKEACIFAHAQSNKANKVNRIPRVTNLQNLQRAPNLKASFRLRKELINSETLVLPDRLVARYPSDFGHTIAPPLASRISLKVFRQFGMDDRMSLVHTFPSNSGTYTVQAPYLSHIGREKPHHPHVTEAIQKSHIR